MTPIRKPAPTVVGVIPGQTATLDLVIGKTYHAIYLAGTVKNTGAPPAITDIFGPGPINVKRNGKVQRAHTAVELDQLNALDGENLRSNIYGATGQLIGYVAVSVAPTVVAGTSAGFAVGDLISLGGGTLANIPGASPAVFMVTAAGALAAANLRLVNPGQYAIAPTTAATAPVVVTGNGTVGTATFAPAAASFGVITQVAPNAYATQIAGEPNAEMANAVPGVPYTGDTATFVIGIFFADMSRDSFMAEQAFAWATKWPKAAIPSGDLDTNGDGSQQLKSLQLEIPIANNANCSLQAVTAYIETTDDLGLLIDANGNVQGSANYSAATSTPWTAIVKWKRTTAPYTAAGEFDITPPRRDAVQQISLFAAAGDAITNLRVVKDGTTMLNLSKNINDETLCKRGMNELGLVPLRYDFVADYTDNPLDALNLNGSNEFIVTPNMATGAGKNLVVITKQYGTPD